MTDDAHEIGEQAAAWHVAALSDTCDWDAFTRWLEADPRHARAYDEIALADTLVTDAAPTLGHEFRDFGPDAAPPPANRMRWPLWAGGAIAASLAMVLAVDEFAAPSPEVYETSGQTREVALADGSRVTLAPDSRLTVDGDRLAVEGGAYFAIRHDPARRLTVHAGTLDVTDIGTMFDIQSGPEATRVAVADGRVTVRGDALDAPIDLPAGRRIALDRGARQVVVSPVAKDEVGSWRSGSLTFSDAPLAVVAADIARYAHVRVSVAPALRTERFSGTLSVADGTTAVEDLARVLGIAAVRTGTGYRLQPNS